MNPKVNNKMRFKMKLKTNTKKLKQLGTLAMVTAVLAFSITGCTTTATETTQAQTDIEISSTNSETNATSETLSNVSNVVTTTSALPSGDYSDKDLDATYDVATATNITLNGSSAKVNGSGATVDGTSVVITTAGTYIITGTLENGQIRVEAAESDDVHLVLNGVSITSQTSAPLYIVSGDKAIITLVEGTMNALTDGTQYVVNADEEPDAALFSTADLTINGTGSLVVEANYNNGIATKDDLVIVSGNLIVTAANDALRGRDSITIRDGAFTISAGGDALQSNNDEDTTKGWIVIDGGTYDIDSGNDALQAQTSLLINGGTFEITAVDDAFHAETSLTIAGGTVDIVESYEALEAVSILVSGGDITIHSSDDGINASGDSGNYEFKQTGGTIYMDAEGDGLDSNGTFYIEGGSIVIDGPVMDGNGALDYDGAGEISGGTLIAAGSSGMAQSPSTGSTQASLMVYFSTQQASGTEISIVNSSGETLLKHTPAKQFQTIVFSDASLLVDETYAIYSDGTKLTDVTLTELIMTISETGETVEGGFGGFGGMQRPSGQGKPGTRP